MSEERKIIEKIYFITKENFGDYSPPYPNVTDVLDDYNILRIDSISAFWEEYEDKARVPHESGIEDTLLGVFSQNIPIIYLIISDGARINIYFGAADQNNKLLKHTLATSFPGITFVEIQNADKAILKQKITQFNHAALIIGTPTNKITKKGPINIQIEGMLRGLYGENWAYIVIAKPFDAPFITSIFNEIAQEIRSISTQYVLKGTVLEENRLAKYYIKLLEAKLAKFQMGKIKGAWDVKSYILTQDKNFLNMCISVVSATFSGNRSLPDHIRACLCTKSVKEDVNNLENYLNTDELAVLTQIPREEFPGYEIKEYSKFGVELSNEKIEDPIRIGEIIDWGKPTGNYFSVPLKKLTRHGLIVGVTGSGKTNTCFYILSQVWNRYKIPFLVIESAKSEYRDLLSNPEFGDCNIFTLGDETVAPFRLNPFEVPEGILVQSHIDYLKSLFNASFVLYAPMPYILEQSIHEIYEDKGWDLVRNQNYRGSNSDRAYPTLSDLYYKNEEVVDRLGYDERISMDVTAALKARINNLRIGGKGLMLDTRKSLLEKDLFEKPVILELKQFVNDEEKAFVIGLLLIRLYEYYEAQSRAGSTADFGKIRHLTLIEEAHRLLKNVPTESQSEESANPKGKAVETFANILSEIRAYGEGILIAEQIPVKLTPDAIKNTNLKIVQRLVAADDREVMGETINLDNKQKKYLTTLQVGEALAYAEGAHKPFLIQIPNYKDNLPSVRTSNQLVENKMRTYYKANLELLHRFESCTQCNERDRHCGRVNNEAEKIMLQIPFKKAFLQLISSFIHSKRLIMPLFNDVVLLIRQSSKVATKEEESCLVYCALTRYAERSFVARGDFYKWKYQKVEILIQLFNKIIQQLAAGYGIAETKKLENILMPLIIKLSEEYTQLCLRERLPFISCRLCTKRCLFQYEVHSLLQDYKILGKGFDDAFFGKGLDEVVDVCIRGAKLVVNNEDHVALRQAALCFAAHKCADIGLITSNQEKLSKDIYELINKKGFAN